MGGHPLAAHGATAPAGAVVAQALSDEGDDPGLTDRVGPPVSKREATAESDKRSRPGLLTGWTHLSARGRQRPNRTSGAGRTGREEVGRGWAGK
jgi:hypothetical protein